MDAFLNKEITLAEKSLTKDMYKWLKEKTWVSIAVHAVNCDLQVSKAHCDHGSFRQLEVDHCNKDAEMSDWDTDDVNKLTIKAGNFKRIMAAQLHGFGPKVSFELDTEQKQTITKVSLHVPFLDGSKDSDIKHKMTEFGEKNYTVFLHVGALPDRADKEGGFCQLIVMPKMS